MRRAVQAIVTLFALWVAIVFVFGFILADRAGRKVASRLASSLQAEWTLGDASLGLVAGNLHLEKLSLRRDDIIGHLTLDVGSVRCDLPPLGIALVDRSCGPLEIEDVKLEISTAALFKLKKREHEPFHADRVVVDNAQLVFLASAFLPDLGKITITVDHAEAGPTTFKTPLSFLFSLEKLTARVELPVGTSIRFIYEGGKLVAQGSVFGSTPVELPVELPPRDRGEDAQSEIERIVTWGKGIAEQLLAQKAEDWLRKRLPLPKN